MKLDEARAFAHTLPDTTEEPHFDMQSFRVRGKIFATVPPDGDHLHIFVSEDETRAAVAENLNGCEELHWGKKLVGVRATLSQTPSELVRELLESAYELKRAARR